MVDEVTADGLPEYVLPCDGPNVGTVHTPPRPSKHNPITQQYAIDQLTDVERLRSVAHTLYEAFRASREQGEHLVEVTTQRLKCWPCEEAAELSDSSYACEKYRAWQKVIDRGLRVI